MVKSDFGVNHPGRGNSDEDASLTRDQALERFGIDLGRVGVMTSARTARNGGVGNTSNRELEQDATAAAGIASNPVGIGREKEDIKVSSTKSKRGRPGSFSTTTDGKDAVAKRQELLSEKLKVLDKLISDEPPRVAPAEEVTKHNEEQEVDLNAQQVEDDPAVVPEENGIMKKNTTAELGAGLSSGGGGGGGTPDVRSLKKTPSPKGLAAKNSGSSCGHLRSKTSTGVLVPDSNEVITGDAVQASHGTEGGGEDQGAVNDVNGNVLIEKAPEKEAVDVERFHIYEKAFPNHR